MPPVAQEPDYGPLSKRLLKLMAERDLSIRALAKLTAAIKQTSPESERKQVRLHLNGGPAEEASIVAYAKAFQVDRSTFPPADPRRSRYEDLTRQVADLERRLEEVAARIPPDVPDRLATLGATADLHRQSIAALDGRLAALERAYIAAQNPPEGGQGNPRARRRKAS